MRLDKYLCEAGLGTRSLFSFFRHAGIAQTSPIAGPAQLIWIIF